MLQEKEKKRELKSEEKLEEERIPAPIPTILL
jgi:hypothetical protein